jgi:hypothetical protein
MAEDFSAPREGVYATFLGLAPGSVSEAVLTAWFEQNAVPLDSSL